MKDRITKKNLEAAVANLNREFGLPLEPYADERSENGALVPNVGTFVLDIANGGYALDRMSEGGGASVAITRGKARETWDCIQAMLAGARAMRAKLTPEYFVTAYAREDGAIGKFATRNFLVRVPETAAETEFPYALIQAIRDQHGQETHHIESHHKTGQ